MHDEFFLIHDEKTFIMFEGFKIGRFRTRYRCGPQSESKFSLINQRSGLYELRRAPTYRTLESVFYVN